MTEFSNEFSSFPSGKITKHNFKNVDDSIASVINQINSLRSQGLYNQAARIIENNADVLSLNILLTLPLSEPGRKKYIIPRSMQNSNSSPSILMTRSLTALMETSGLEVMLSVMQPCILLPGKN